MTDVGDIETGFNPILLSEHGLQRRLERKLTTRELHIAVKHGVKVEANGANGEKRWMYTFAGVVVITNEDSSTIVTTWNLPCYGIEVPKAAISNEMQRQHERALEKLKDLYTWTSHTVVVVDQSGSMRETDAERGLTRSDLVWLTLALSLIADNLKKGERKATDVFSLVLMQDRGEIVLYCQPFDWILYNTVVDLLRTQQPQGAGNYFPAMNSAQMLLRKNNYSGCALLLLFLSDGRPSDHFRKGENPTQLTHSIKIKKQIGKIACRLGSRLAVGAIPVGKPKQDEFITLRALKEGAEEYGSHGFFQPPTLSANLLALAMTKLSSTTTSTMVEMRNRQFRKFRKEPVSNVGGDVLTNDFEMARMKETTAITNGRRGKTISTIIRTRWNPSQGWMPYRRNNIFHSDNAVGIAVKKAWFSEGAERLVKEFREVGEDNSFVGPLLVAKDTKYLHESTGDAVSDAKDFHKVFCKTQLKAQKYAGIFNEKMLKLEYVDARETPTLEFLSCSVYMVESPTEGRQAYLVERMLDIKSYGYQKWNDNAGQVGETLLEALVEEGEDSDSDMSAFSHSSGGSTRFGDLFGGRTSDSCFSSDEIPQAFSCFSYWESERRFLICDLQGVFNTALSPPMFELTDPVIHHRESSETGKKYGPSDKGLEGMNAFFSSHKCSNLCRMIKSRFRVDIDVPQGLGGEVRALGA